MGMVRLPPLLGVGGSTRCREVPHKVRGQRGLRPHCAQHPTPSWSPWGSGSSPASTQHVLGGSSPTPAHTFPCTCVACTAAVPDGKPVCCGPGDPRSCARWHVRACPRILNTHQHYLPSFSLPKPPRHLTGACISYL